MGASPTPRSSRGPSIFLLNTISYLAVLAALFLLRDLPPRGPRAPGSLRGWLGEGLSYVRGTRIVLALLALSFVGNLLGRSYLPLLAVFARSIFHVGSTGYGLMVTATGLGTLAGAVGLAGYGDVRAKGRLIVLSAAAFCLALGLFALQPPYPLAIALLVAAGLTSTLFSASLATMLQLRVPRDLRGRVMSLYTITLIGVSSLGSLGSAAVAAAFSAPTAYLSGAALLALVVLLVARRFWPLRDEGSPA